MTGIEQNGYELTVPEAYRETGTLPVYQAVEADFTKTVIPEWFNGTGAKDGADAMDIRYKDDRDVLYADHARLFLSPEALFYNEYADDAYTEAASGAIVDIIWLREWENHRGEFTLEKTELSGITLAEAQAQAEEMMGKLGIACNQYICDEALDMSLERIQTMGAIWEKAIADGLQFEQRPFLFTDEPLTRGETASVINARFYESNDHKTSNKASNCAFYYQEGINRYFRQSLMGKAEKNNVDFNYDRATENMLTFSNVIVLRIPFKSQNAYGTWYSYTEGNYTGSGQADIFQSGRYIKGAWYRDELMGRLVLIDDEGNELKLQRGKTFFIVNDSRCVISYE